MQAYKRVLGIIISVIMLATMLPVAAFADGEGDRQNDAAVYKLSVESIHAGDSAESGADVEEESGYSIGTTSWFSTEEDALAALAYFAGDTSQEMDMFRGKFQAGETYYSVAMVDFEEGDVADVDRVILNENDCVKQVGSPLTNEAKTRVVVAFSYTIPAITVTVDFGAKHAAYAEQVAANPNDDDVVMTASNGMLTYKAEKGADRWFDVLGPLRDAMYKMETMLHAHEQIKVPYLINLKPLSAYANAEEFSKDFDDIEDHGPQNEDLKVYAQWEKPAKQGSFTLRAPLCGTVVEVKEMEMDHGGSDDGEGQGSGDDPLTPIGGDDPYPVPKEQTNTPKGTTDKNSQLILVDSEYYTASNWYKRYDVDLITPYAMFGDDWYAGIITGGNTYYAGVQAYPAFGYFLDTDDPPTIKVNGEAADSKIPQFSDYQMVSVMAKVKAVHDWGAWKQTKAPTTTKEGEEARTCKYCGAKETRPIPKLKPAKENVFTEANIPARTMKMTWKKTKGAVGYKVAYRERGGKWTKKTVKKTSYTIEGMKKNKFYEFKVAPIVKKGKKKVTGKYKDISYRYFNAVKGKAKGVKGGVNLTWTKEPKANGYIAYCSTSKSMKNGKSVQLKGKNKQSYTFKGLKKGKTYYVMVRSYIKKGGKKYLGVTCTIRKVKVK